MTVHLHTEISDHEIAVLNAARAILKAHSTFSYDPVDVGEVRAAVEAEHAEYAIFQYLNVTNAYLDRAMSHEQIHNAPLAPVTAVEAGRDWSVKA